MPGRTGQIEDVNFGNVFPYRYDRRHDISIALTHYLSDKLTLGATWVYGTGRAVTLAKQKYPGLIPSNDGYVNVPVYYYGQDQLIEYYESRNGFREPAYHRLDVSLNFHKKKKWGERTVSIGVYNLYNRQNPFFLYYGTKFVSMVSMKTFTFFNEAFTA
ncbi:MAG: TonB-dependent receptor [Bacteroidales bacterium]|nr:TonB-dependent receptor [Bacteroidales bacterium]